MNGKRSGRLILKQVIQWRLLLLLDNRQTHEVPGMFKTLSFVSTLNSASV